MLQHLDGLVTADSGLGHRCEGSEVLLILPPMQSRASSQAQARRNQWISSVLLKRKFGKLADASMTKFGFGKLGTEQKIDCRRRRSKSRGRQRQSTAESQ